MSIVLGAIADDFTGATDLAGTWVKEGVKTVQTVGVPGGGTDIGDAEAVVVALKSRTAPVGEAVSQSLEALHWLCEAGARQVVFKYCSTFDSTGKGNIGPVADALADALDADFALVCPAVPTNGRTVYRGYLYVGDMLLSESPMKDHPLTPMRDSSLVRLMAAQSQGRVGLVPLQDVSAGVEYIRSRIAALKADGVRYGVIDAVADAELRLIGAAASDHKLVTGGSGIGMGLPENFRRSGLLSAGSPPALPETAGREVVLAGSCSAATRAQIAAVKGLWPARKLDPDGLAAGSGEVEDAIAWALARPADEPILVYASAGPEEVSAVQARYGVEQAGRMFESAFERIAAALAGNGFSRFVVAGGETAGAVVSALGVTVLRIGPEIAPGVPWTEAAGDRPLVLALKSGNFGSKTFFANALGMLP